MQIIKASNDLTLFAEGSKMSVEARGSFGKKKSGGVGSKEKQNTNKVEQLPTLPT